MGPLGLVPINAMILVSEGTHAKDVPHVLWKEVGCNLLHTQAGRTSANEHMVILNRLKPVKITGYPPSPQTRTAWLIAP